MFSIFKRNAKLVLKERWSVAIMIVVLLVFLLALLTFMETLALRFFVLDPAASNPTMEPQFSNYAELLRYLFDYSLPEMIIMAVFLLLSVLLTAPLTLGVQYWYYLLVQDRSPSFSDVFHYFDGLRRYGRSIAYYVSVNVRLLLWAIPFNLLPGGLLAVSVYFLYTQDLGRVAMSTATMGLFLSIGLFLLSGVLFAIFSQRYALAPYLLFEEDKYTVRKALRTSVRYAKGYKSSIFLLNLSFIGWALLTPFTLGLILLFLHPYMNATVALYARYLIEKNDRQRLPSQQQATQEFRPATDPAAPPWQETSPPPAGGEKNK